MNSYSQNREDLVMWDIVREEINVESLKGRILDLGANGPHLSNSLLFIENGWEAVCVEPAPKAFQVLQELHKGNENVLCYQVAISDYNGYAEFYDSGTHLNKGDTSLLSTLNQADRDKWAATTTFESIKVPVKTFFDFMIECPKKTFDIISVDCEGEDWKILQQMNLISMKTCIVCIEWNSKNLEKYDGWFMENWPGCKLVHKNAENLIYYRQRRSK